MDGDLDTIYGEFNGNIDNANIKPGAGIDGTKINVTTFADGSIPAAKLVDQSVTDQQIQVGAAVHGIVSVLGTTGLSGITVETDIAVLPALTTRGGRVLLFGGVSLNAVDRAGVENIVTLRYYRDVTLIYALNYNTAADASGEIPIPTPMFQDHPVAGTYVYKLTAAPSSNSLATAAANPGALFAMELA